MATPTASQLGTIPSPASRKTAVPNNVSTPGTYNLSSPAPRSIPSPATTRKEQAGKTPAGHPTGSTTGTKTVGGTPMIPNLSQQGSIASPVTGVLAGVTPTGLGVDLGTPALAAVMMPTMSDLGLTTSGGAKRNEDEERRAKMRKIIKSIGHTKGRVSEEGIARISRRVGFANDIDAEKLTAEERERRVGNRTISIAGNTIVIDVELKQHIPTSVQIVFSNDMSNAGDNAIRAGKILFDDLSSSNTPQINTTLDKFAANLDRLARLDKLSTKTNCFDALSGIYASLKRLYDQERQLAAALGDDNVLNHRSGRPALHEDGAIGLSLTYRQTALSRQKLWIEAEKCPTTLYPSIRVSESWLPESFDLTADAPIPWNDTPVQGGGAEDSNLQGQDIRFVAKLDPPLVLPWPVATGVFAAVGASLPATYSVVSYFDLLRGYSSDISSRTRQIVVSATGDTVSHVYNVDVTTGQAGYTLQEAPFSHPREIIELLPTLRQWQAYNEVLLSQFDIKQPIDKKDSSNAPMKPGDVLEVEVSINTSPSPELWLAFPLAEASIYTAVVNVLPNGELDLLASIPTISKADIALKRCGDIGVWIEWIRGRKHKT